MNHTFIIISLHKCPLCLLQLHGTIIVSYILQYSNRKNWLSNIVSLYYLRLQTLISMFLSARYNGHTPEHPITLLLLLFAAAQ